MRLTLEHVEFTRKRTELAATSITYLPQRIATSLLAIELTERVRLPFA